MSVQSFPFNQLFQESPDGSLTPLKPINIQGVIVGPGVSFGKGVSIGGVDVHALKSYQLAVEDENGSGILKLKGYYPHVPTAQ